MNGSPLGSLQLSASANGVANGVAPATPVHTGEAWRENAVIPSAVLPPTYANAWSGESVSRWDPSVALMSVHVSGPSVLEPSNVKQPSLPSSWLALPVAGSRLMATSPADLLAM